MHIISDIDDCLLSFIVPFLEYCNNINNTTFSINDMISYDFPTVLRIEWEETIELVEQFYTSEEFMDLPPLHGAVRAIQHLSTLHQIVCSTSRPDHITIKTKRQIEKHFSSSLKSIYFMNTYTDQPRLKSDVARIYNSDLAIEDSASHALDFSNYGVRVLLPRYPWNTTLEHELVTPVSSWDEIIDRIDGNDFRVRKNTSYFR